MPYSIDWYIENELIYLHYEGVISTKELRDSILDMNVLIDSSPRPLVHIINDVGDITKPVSPKESLEIIRDIGHHERTGWDLILREQSPLVKMGVAFGTSIFKSRTRTFDTLRQAKNFMMEQDSTIHWDQANESIIVNQ